MNSYLSHLIDAWKSLTVLVVGDVMLDCYLNGNSECLCQEAPVPVVAVTQRQDFPGGAANVAANVVSLGAKALLLSVTGQDAECDRLHLALKQRGISTDCLIPSPERTTLAKQRVMASSHLLVRFDQGSTTAISAELEDQVIQQLLSLYPICDAVIVSDYGYGVLTPRVIQTLAHLQRQYERVLVVDSKKLKAYQKVRATAVKPNYSEAIQLLDLPKQLEHRSEQIAPYGPRLLTLSGAEIVAATLDTEGAILFERDQLPLFIHTHPVPAQYTSGAGDTFVSALALALAKKTPTPIAATITSAATAIVVKQIGTATCQAEELRQSLLEQTHPTFNLHPAYA